MCIHENDSIELIEQDDKAKERGEDKRKEEGDEKLLEKEVKIEAENWLIKWQ